METDNIRSIYFFKNQEQAKSSKERNKDLIKLLEADLNYKLRRREVKKEIMVKEIKIFIASQGILKDERQFIENLIRNKTDKLISKGIYLKPILWEREDKSISITRKQDEFNEMLLDSEYVIYLTWNSIGHYTKEEFEIGYNSLKSGIKPFKIYVFNKSLARPITTRSDIQGAADYLDLKDQLWTDERIVIEFENNHTIQNELEHMFTDIENKYSS